MLVFSMSDKFLVPYRQRSAGRVLLLPRRLKRAVWIRRFGLNRVGIWQGRPDVASLASASVDAQPPMRSLTAAKWPKLRGSGRVTVRPEVAADLIVQCFAAAITD